MLRVSLTYSLSGQDIVRETGSFPYLKSGTIITPFGATNLRLTIQYLVFIGIWQDVLLNYNLQSTNKYYLDWRDFIFLNLIFFFKF